MASNSVVFCQMVSNLKPSHSHRVGPSIALAVHHTKVPAKGSAGQGTQPVRWWVLLPPCAGASVGSALRAALWYESFITLAKMLSFLRYFSYLSPDTVSPASPSFLIRTTGFIHVHHNSQKPLGIYDKNSE